VIIAQNIDVTEQYLHRRAQLVREICHCLKP
jgi:hypothetical protein